MNYNVTCSTDDNYLQHCVAMLCSLFENNKEYSFTVHLLVDKLSKESKDFICSLCERYGNTTKFYAIEKKLLENIRLNDIQFNGHKMYSIATYYRMFLPSLLPSDVEKVLYLDCDIIVLKDVSELFNMNLDGYGVAAVRDSSPYDSYHRYKMGLSLRHSAFCAGMMMINLDYWRVNNSQKKLLEYANRQWKDVYMQDQDALNYVFRDSWFQLPYKWGKTPFSVAVIDETQRWFDIKEYENEPCIYHYSSQMKPWIDVWFPDRYIYWDYLRKSKYPNTKVTHANKDLRMKVYKANVRFFLNKYLRPFIPNFIELLVCDILYIFRLLLYIIKPSHMGDIILKRWYQKYVV